MRAQVLLQPDEQLGVRLVELLAETPLPSRCVLVSAWGDRTALLRLRNGIRRLSDAGTAVTVVLGVDLGGTSEEALREVAAWSVDAWVFKNRRPGHTFHPKVYLIVRDGRADLIVGSNNLTGGGLFRNYEANVHLTFNLPRERRELDTTLSPLGRILAPSPPLAIPLTSDLIDRLVERGTVRAEKAMKETARKRMRRDAEDSPFGSEVIPDPPPLPADILGEVTALVRREKRSVARKTARGKKVAVGSKEEIQPDAFYMTLNPLQGESIPGEARVPKAARDLAENFWGWPEQYRRETRTQGAKEREYWNWKPAWRVFDVAVAGSGTVEDVRMYEYVASADFRFFSPQLVALGADEGDIVRIRRIADESAEYECALAKRGSATHAKWDAACTEPVTNSDRRFGYA